jgi:hypothetical protein
MQRPGRGSLGELADLPHSTRNSAKKIPEAANPRGAEDSSCFRGRLDQPVLRFSPVFTGLLRRTVMVRTVFSSQNWVNMFWAAEMDLIKSIFYS